MTRRRRRWPIEHLLSHRPLPQPPRQSPGPHLAALLPPSESLESSPERALPGKRRISALRGLRACAGRESHAQRQVDRGKPQQSFPLVTSVRQRMSNARRTLGRTRCRRCDQCTTCDPSTTIAARVGGHVVGARVNDDGAAVASNREFGPGRSENRSTVTWIRPRPFSSIVMLGRSPACGPRGFAEPC